MLVIMSWSYWINSNVTEANLMICLPICIDLDTCGASLGEVVLKGWVSPWLDLIVFCICVSTLFMREAICRYFSSTVLVSLSMVRAIFASCSFMDVVSVAYYLHSHWEEEVKELEWSEELSCFDTPIGEPMVELASSIGYRDLSSKSFIA